MKTFVLWEKFHFLFQPSDLEVKSEKSIPYTIYFCFFSNKIGIRFCFGKKINDS